MVTNQLHAPIVRAQAPGVTVLEEPLGRNTAAAIALATVALDAPEDAVMVVLPADQQVADEGHFEPSWLKPRRSWRTVRSGSRARW